MGYRRHWVALALVVAGSFAVLGGLGPRIAGGAPPVPSRVVLPDGRVLLDGEAIRRGQAVWQSLGGQEVGSVWGHGAYVAPDWTADWLHREVGILQTWASVETGTWWARSAEFLHGPGMNTLRWLRVPGDTIFAVGALFLAWFVLGLATGWSLARGGRHVDAGSTEERDATVPAEGRA